MRKILPLLLSFVFAAVCGVRAGAKAGGEAPDFTLPDIEGNTRALADLRGKVVVLEWTNYDCPFVRRHYASGAMQALQKEYTEKGVVWLTVCSSAPGKQGNYPPAEWKRMIEEKEAACTALLLDLDGTVGKAYGATATPHVFVIGTGGTLVYAGAPDDNPSFRDKEGARSYLREAVDAALAGESPEVTETRAYGCSVKY
jgi:peroxiredoxin